jgi:predicted acylesterase/phospholipase RssA
MERAVLTPAIAILLALLPGIPAQAEPRAALESPLTPISLTVSGGVSLGAYEAGYLYYTSRFIKENKLRLSLKLVTGASAGAINSLLSVLSACSTHRDGTPSESLFWRTWMAVGFRELLGTPANRRASAAFTTEALERSAIGVESAWMNGIDQRCDVVLGVATTLLKPKQLRLTAGIHAEHQEEPFVLRIQGRGPGRPPILSNYVDARDTMPHALLYLPEDDQARFRALKSLLLASAAFPAAFPPVRLKFCRTDPHKPEAACTEASAKEEYFIDGGVFDNEPLRLAARIAARGLKQDGSGFRWSDSPDLAPHPLPSALRFKAIDVDAKAYPAESSRPAGEVREDEEPIVPYFLKFVSRFVASARSQQLYSVLEENPSLENTIQSSVNNFPLASEPGLAFAGFFDRGFRESDFYMGMYDARRAVLNWKENQNRILVFPEGLEPGQADWKIFGCVKATLDRTDDRARLCAGPEMANMRKLLQLSLIRLYDTCGSLGPDADLSAFPSADCRAAARGEPPPVVAADTRVVEWKRRRDENENRRGLRVLAESHYRFEFVDDLEATPREVLVAFKSEVKTAFDNLADRQPSGDRFLLNFAGEPAFNFISYSPPQREYHFLLGELVEAAGSLALSDWVRVHAALTARRPQDLFASGYGDFALAPLAGVEVEPQWLSGALIQPRLGARAGYQFTPADGWGARACGVGDDCSRFVVEPYLAATVYERMRLQFVEQILPPSRQQAISFNSFIQLGVELTP